jgi:hypothetical protein
MLEYDPSCPLSIGKPIPNSNVYLLDEDENPVPIGGTGLMWYVILSLVPFHTLGAEPPSRLCIRQQIKTQAQRQRRPSSRDTEHAFADIFARVGGRCVSRGYLNLPELTSARYKLDKFQNDG